MFFDVLKPLYLGRFRAFYVFWSVFTKFLDFFFLPAEMPCPHGFQGTLPGAPLSMQFFKEAP